MARRDSQGAKKAAQVAAQLSDVARHAGVSTATVSRVLNAAGPVSAATRLRVEEACRVLGYVPNGAARALSSRRMRAIGAVVPTIESEGFAAAIAGLQSQLNQAGFSLLLASSQYDAEMELREIRMLLSHGIDGLMVVGGSHHPDLMPLLEAKVPFVETWTLSKQYPCVGFDNISTGRRIADYLQDIGHEKIGILTGRSHTNDRAAARVAGIRESLASRGRRIAGEWLIERPDRVSDGRSGMRALLASEARPTAVICGNDQLAFGAMIEARSQGVSIPGDISITGFNDLDFAASLDPPLTTMHIPAEKIGRLSGEYLLNRIAGGLPMSITEVEVDLIVRGSTGPPRGVA